MSSHLTSADRWRVISLKVDHKASVPDLFRKTNDVVEREGRGGGNSLTNNETHSLRQLLYRYPDETSTQLNSQFYRRAGRFVTPRAIRNYPRRLGFRPVHARIQPLINQRYADERLAFCQQHIHDDWCHVIFGDEKIFEVDTSGIIYWIPYGRPRPTTFRSQVQYRITVFGAVWHNNRPNLVFIRGRTNTSTFIEYLEDGPHSHRRLIRNYHFIHDRPMWAHTVTAD